MATPDSGRRPALEAAAAAALGEPWRVKIRTEATCGVCQDFYAEPVLLRCGSSFCRACVGKLAVCPDCGADCALSPRTANRPLARLVEVAQRVLEEEKTRPEASGMATGGEKPSLEEEAFLCKPESALLRLGCDKPPEPRGPDDAMAAQECRSHIQKCLTILKREETDFLLNKITLEIDYEFHKRRVALMLKKTKAEFQLMEEFLENQKREQLVHLMEVYKEIKTDRTNQFSALSQKLSSLQDVMYEMDEATQMPECELLENIGVILQRLEEKDRVQHIGSLSLDLRRQIMGLTSFNMVLQDSMKHFREMVQQQKAKGQETTGIDVQKSADE